ncbi:MAG: hypothetical protein WCI04_05110 [archaeon]
MSNAGKEWIAIIRKEIHRCPWCGKLTINQFCLDECKMFYCAEDEQKEYLGDKQ